MGNHSMTRLRSFTLVALGLGSVVVYAGCGAATSPSSTNSVSTNTTIVWREDSFETNDVGSAAGDNWLANQIAQQTGGHFKIEISYNAVLGASSEIPNLIKTDTVQIGEQCISYYPSDFPYFNAITLPFFPATPLAVQEKIDLAMFQLPYVKQQVLSEWNAIPLWANAFPTDDMIGDKPVTSISDLSGLRISISSTLGQPLVHYGAVIDDLVSTDFYTSMASHVVDEIASLPNAFEEWKLYEVAKYMTVGLDIGYQLCWRDVSATAYNSLPTAWQQDLQKDALEAEVQSANSINSIVNAGVPQLAADGVQTVTMPASMVAQLKSTASTEWTQYEDTENAAGYHMTEFINWYQSEAKKLGA
jgi:TRAP-type C4-dicarboxylate transport system substrate-binding protein